MIIEKITQDIKIDIMITKGLKTKVHQEYKWKRIVSGDHDPGIDKVINFLEKNQIRIKIEDKKTKVQKNEKVLQ